MLRKELEDVKAEINNILSNFDEIQKNSLINMMEDPSMPLTDFQKGNNSSIHFNTLKPGLKTSIILEYEDKLHHDLQLRDLSTEGNILDCQLRLQQQLIQEYNYKRLQSSINHVDSSGIDGKFILLADCPPCILHMAMRTTLKFLQMILHEGLKYQLTINKTLKGIQNFVRRVRLVFNEEIFGSKIRPCTVSVNYDKKEKVIEDITLDGNRCRKLIEKIQPLLNLCIHNKELKARWEKIIYHYKYAFEILRSKEDLNYDQIKEFQLHVDIFYQDYVELYARDGITNYFHMLGAGHVADYLLRCGNLYIHSQQGWEAFNSFLKVFYFRRTTRGGGRGNECNKLRQMGKWLARRLLWNSGYSFEEITKQNVFGIDITAVSTNSDDEYNDDEDNEFTICEHQHTILDDEEDCDFSLQPGCLFTEESEEIDIEDSHCDHLKNDDTENLVVDMSYECAACTIGTYIVGGRTYCSTCYENQFVSEKNNTTTTSTSYNESLHDIL